MGNNHDNHDNSNDNSSNDNTSLMKCTLKRLLRELLGKEVRRRHHMEIHGQPKEPNSVKLEGKNEEKWERISC